MLARSKSFVPQRAMISVRNEKVLFFEFVLVSLLVQMS